MQFHTHDDKGVTMLVVGLRVRRQCKTGFHARRVVYWEYEWPYSDCDRSS